MSNPHAMSSLSGMVNGAEVESDIDMMSPLDSNQENHEPPKKTRGKRQNAKTRKTKPASKRLSAAKLKPAAKPVAKPAVKPRGRKPASKAQVAEQPSDTEEVEEFEEGVEEATGSQQDVSTAVAVEVVATKPQPKRKGRPPGKAKQAKVEPIPEQTKTLELDGEFEFTPRASQQEKAPSKGKGRIINGRETSPERTATGTQPLPMALDDSPFDGDEISVEPQSIHRQASHPRSSYRRAQSILTNTRRRGGSASDTERITDPALRRKLGELTMKCESLELKYRKLREIGIKEAETNFEKLKKQSEEQTRAANDLIASLRKELSIQKAQVNEARSQRAVLTSTQSNLTTAEVEIAELKASLTNVQNENNTLQAKLTASRSAATNGDSTSAYLSSAAKGKAPASRTPMTGSADASNTAQIAQLKEDLYSDLTGLILRGVDRQEETDTYDCIQTGRNGTLHFKLVVPTDTSVSYEENEIQYLPRLDGSRDRALLEILPDYLTDEITFSVGNASKFYSRVMDTLTKRYDG